VRTVKGIAERTARTGTNRESKGDMWGLDYGELMLPGVKTCWRRGEPQGAAMGRDKEISQAEGSGKIGSIKAHTEGS
jgi:hypothetical protein